MPFVGVVVNVSRVDIGDFPAGLHLRVNCVDG